jgi:flagellar biosynthesis protein FlhB
MAEESSDEDKTEEPSQKKLREAREKGQIPQSREVNTWVMLFTATLLLVWMGTWFAENMTEMLRQFIAQPHAFDMSAGGVGDMFMMTSAEMARIAGIPVIVFLVIGVLASLAQTGPVISGHSLTPDLEKINPLKGMKRIFGARAWQELIKAILKVLIVGGVTSVIIWPVMNDAVSMVGISIPAITELLHEDTRRLLVAVVSVLFVFAAADYGLQYFQIMKQLRMSKQEIKDEYKQTEGDPHIKARLRELRMQRARKRMMAQVPTADVVITNPTHFAIALEYKQDKSGAPVVVAKGLDRIALKIREIAKDNEVPIVENPPLARALYDTVELDEEIPEQHYKAVAEIISYVFSLNRKKKR